MSKKIQKLTLSALFLALGLILPFITGQIPQIGNMLLPMHIPVLFCGLICGKEYGFLVGLMMPLLRHFLFQMPPINSAIPMTFELAAYGFVIGYVYHKTSKDLKGVFLALAISLLVGRIVLAFAQLIFFGIIGNPFSFSMFITSAFVTSIPGIILQLFLIPLIMKFVNRYYA